MTPASSESFDGADLPSFSATKTEWRRWARARHAAGAAQGTESGILAALDAHLETLDRGVVVLFSALPGEVSVAELAEGGRHRFAITRTPPRGWLTIHAWEAERERHPYGFSQPVADAPEIPLREIVAVLVPALAFDREGYRLGRGAGYYDELFSRMPAHVRRIGVTPSTLIVDELPRDAHDIPMHVLATENGCSEIR
jgi:5-formyltetrahydrofolate cyclo-ligase